MNGESPKRNWMANWEEKQDQIFHGDKAESSGTGVAEPETAKKTSSDKKQEMTPDEAAAHFKELRRKLFG